MNAIAIGDAIILASQTLTALLNVAGASSAVSKIIGDHIASQQHEWSDIQRDLITLSLAGAHDLADRQIHGTKVA